MSKLTAWPEPLLESPHQVGDKARRVRQMFNSIARRYELVNSLFSFGRDAYWRRKAVQLARVRPDDDVLDVACGTGDFARAFAEASPKRIVGIDFAHEMLVRAATAPANAQWAECDALRLPFPDGAFSIVSCAFGVRNLADLETGLVEMHRVLRPGGRIAILEFSRPAGPIMRRGYEWYSNKLMPAAATWVSGDTSGAYRYLPRSVVSFLDATQMCEKLRQCGFGNVQATALTFGVVTVYVGLR